MKIFYSWKIHSPPPHCFPVPVLAWICSTYSKKKEEGSQHKPWLCFSHSVPLLVFPGALLEHKQAWLAASIVSIFLFTQSGLCFSLASFGSHRLGLQDFTHISPPLHKTPTTSPPVLSLTMVHVGICCVIKTNHCVNHCISYFWHFKVLSVHISSIILLWLYSNCTGV